MDHHEITVSIGDVVQIGDHIVTICDIEDGELFIQVHSGEGDCSLAAGESVRLAIPR